MFFIETYQDFCRIMDLKKSDNPIIRNEAKKALGILRQKDPKRFNEYKTWSEGFAPEVPVLPTEPKKKRKTSFDKENYIKEHPEIDVEELRKNARARMQKDKYGFGLRADVPVWMTEEDLLSSVDQLSIADLITGSGKPVTRQTIIKKCIKIAVADRRIDEAKLRSYVCGVFCGYYNKKVITPPASLSYEMVKVIINQEATIEELVKISDGATFNLAELTMFIYRRAKQMPDSERERVERIVEKKAERKARKKAKWEALKAETEAKINNKYNEL